MNETLLQHQFDCANNCNLRELLCTFNEKETIMDKRQFVKYALIWDFAYRHAKGHFGDVDPRMYRFWSDIMASVEYLVNPVGSDIPFMYLGVTYQREGVLLDKVADGIFELVTWAGYSLEDAIQVAMARLRSRL